MSYSSTRHDHATFGGLSLELSNAFVRLQKKHCGRGPTAINVHLHDDLVVAVMRNCSTTFERTLVSCGAHEQADAQRRLLQREFVAEATEVVERVVRRRVRSGLDDCDLQNDVQVFLFLLGPAA